ncbi:hypothetical protein RHOFW510R12_00925 [Rhodanobacter sp. FW510-R12]|uniref:hypothetical protein n=1 Tax=Rhodanobacter thiooxydans TaxID=416169 RepID=UPI000916FF42|nr:hypothetical protein [Rhodanobacter thiooxydans]UJJ56832.1 hypothetical protein LRK53_19010 [Rhodanobacter thiooxydans]
MECFRIDESGYTGYDLLNRDQPFQGATAIAIDDDAAGDLIRRHFPRLQAGELKYRDLMRRPANHSRLLALQRDVLTNYKCVTYVCDKRFLLLLMFADYAIEPYYYERGINFYENGQNYSLASLLYLVGPQLLGEGALDRLLTCFQRAVHDKTPKALADLVASARASRWRDLPEALGPLATAAPECLAAIATHGVTTDAAFIVLQALISRTEVMAAGPYRIEHDESDNLRAYHRMLQRLISHQEPATFRQSDIASLTFPLKLTSVSHVNSRSSAAVQLADVMIGAAVEAASTLTGRRRARVDPEATLSQYTDNQLIHLLPSIDFAEQARARQGTQAAELIDYYAAHFAGE